MRVIGDGGIFSRHPERIPPHGVKHIKAPHLFVARDNVADRVISHVPHMNLAGRIGKHLQKVILFFVRIFRHLKQPVRFPVVLPLLFDVLWIVFFVHEFRYLRYPF